MNFYRRRPLAAAISFCITVSAAAFIFGANAGLILIAVILAAVPTAVFIFHRCKLKLLFNLPPSVFVIMTGVITLCTLISSFAYFNVYGAGYAEEAEAEICAVITEVKSQRNYGGTYKIKLYSVDGEKDRGVGLLSDETGRTFALGDVIFGQAVFCEIGDVYGDSTASVLSAISDGCVFACKASDDIEVIGTRSSVGVRLAKFREVLSAKLSLYLDRDSAALAKALIIGDRRDLGRIRRDFNYLGVTHILALSGLHLSVMSGIIDRLLLSIGLGRKSRTVLLVAVIGFYVAFTGFLMSVMRAAIMLIISYIAMFVSAENDRVTSLFFAVWLIILVYPPAIFDVSLQLSFFATLGVVLLGESARAKAPDTKIRNRAIRRLFFGARSIVLNIFASLGAIMFVLPLQWVYFREISVLSVPATVIMAIVCEVLLTLLLPYLIFSAAGFGFICARLGGIIMILCELCGTLAQRLSENTKLVSLRYPFALSLILCFAVVILLMMLKNCRSWLYSLIPLFAACALFFGCTVWYENVHRDEITVDYLNHGKHDVIVTVSERHAMIVDITDGSRSAMYDACAVLAGHCITEVDTLMLTDIDRGHTGSVRTLLERRRVRRLLIPMPASEYEGYLVNNICRTAEEYGAQVILYSTDSETAVDFGDVRMTLPERTFIGRSSVPLTALRMEADENDIVYMGASSWESDYVWSFTGGADVLILGENGPVIKTAPEGNVPYNVKHIMVASKERIATLSDWIYGYSGTVSCDEVHRIRINGVNP